MKEILILLALMTVAVTGCQSMNDDDANSTNQTPATKPGWPPPSPNTMNYPPPTSPANH